MKFALLPRLFYYLFRCRNPKFFFLLYLFYVNIKSSKPVFLQVGANDGFRYDPIYHLLKISGVQAFLLEPIHSYYMSLCSLHSSRSNRIKCINLAIDSVDGEIDLYRIREDAVSESWMHGIASKNPFHFKKTMPSACADTVLVSERVRAVTFESLFFQYSIETIDVLVIDVEGFDFDVLRLFPFHTVSPGIVMLECDMSLSDPSYADVDVIDYMRTCGYSQYSMVGADLIFWRA
jgi:FkbM family methyltransferase